MRKASRVCQCVGLISLLSSGCMGIPLGDATPGPPIGETSVVASNRGDTLLVVVADRDLSVASSPALAEGAMADLHELTVGADGDKNTWRTYLWFDLAVIPARAEVSAAELLMTAGDTTGGDATRAEVLVKPITEAWSPKALSWRAQPLNDETEDPTTTTIGRGDHQLRVDITELVQAWQSGARQNHGVVVRLADESQSFRQGFVSVEAERVKAAPQIQIHYTLP